MYAWHPGNSPPGTSSPIQNSFFGLVLHGKSHGQTGLHWCQQCRETPQAQILHQRDSVWLSSRPDMMTFTDWDLAEPKQLIKWGERGLLTHTHSASSGEGLTWERNKKLSAHIQVRQDNDFQSQLPANTQVSPTQATFSYLFKVRDMANFLNQLLNLGDIRENDTEVNMRRCLTLEDTLKDRVK